MHQALLPNSLKGKEKQHKYAFSAEKYTNSWYDSNVLSSSCLDLGISQEKQIIKEGSQGEYFTVSLRSLVPYYISVVTNSTSKIELLLR